MINQNSPIVQQMMNNLSMPNQMGNFNPSAYQSQNNIQMYPDPMQMAQGYVYNGPTPQTNIVGYNTNMVNPLNGYSNPYFNPNPMMQNIVPNFSVVGNSYRPNFIGYNQYNIDPTTNRFYGFDPNNEVSKSIMDSAMNNGSTYMEQLNLELEIAQKALDIVFKNDKGYSEEEQEQIRSIYKITTIDPEKIRQEALQRMNNNSISIVVIVTRGDEIVSDSSMRKPIDEYSIYRCDMDVQMENIIYANFINRINYLLYRDQWLYDTAIEREADNMSLYDFMTKVAPKIVRQMKNEEFRQRQIAAASDLYNGEEYRRLLENNTGKKYPNPYNPMIQGQNGIYPNGQIVSSGIDPRIAEGFIRDPNTGTITMTVPDFMKNRMDDSPFKENIIQQRNDERKAAFMRSLHDNVVREEILRRNG